MITTLCLSNKNVIVATFNEFERNENKDVFLTKISNAAPKANF